MRWRFLIALVVVLAIPAAGCKDGGKASVTGTAAVRVPVGANATFEDVPYIAIEQVGLDRLPRTRLEESGEARIESLARRVAAFRLKDQPKAALRYTIDGAQGWLAWEPQAVLYARRALAKQENATATQIQTVDVTSETWPDGCLGVVRPSASCTEATVPGFRVTLRLGSRTFEYHTDQNDHVERATP